MNVKQTWSKYSYDHKHDYNRSRSKSPVRSNSQNRRTECKFFARGKCNRGDGCKFLHSVKQDRVHGVDKAQKQNDKSIESEITKLIVINYDHFKTKITQVVSIDNLREMFNKNINVCPLDIVPSMNVSDFNYYTKMWNLGKLAAFLPLDYNNQSDDHFRGDDSVLNRVKRLNDYLFLVDRLTGRFNLFDPTKFQYCSNKLMYQFWCVLNKADATIVHASSRDVFECVCSYMSVMPKVNCTKFRNNVKSWISYHDAGILYRVMLHARMNVDLLPVTHLSTKLSTITTTTTTNNYDSSFSPDHPEDDCDNEYKYKEPCLLTCNKKKNSDCNCHKFRERILGEPFVWPCDCFGCNPLISGNNTMQANPNPKPVAVPPLPLQVQAQEQTHLYATSSLAHDLLVSLMKHFE